MEDTHSDIYKVKYDSYHGPTKSRLILKSTRTCPRECRCFGFDFSQNTLLLLLNRNTRGSLNKYLRSASAAHRNIMKYSRRQISLQYMSDLHLERINYQFSVNRAAPILILGGDIGRFCDYDRYRDFLAKLCQDFDLVLLIAGNHEFYGASRSEGLSAARRLTDEPCMLGKLRFLNRTRIDLPQTRVTLLACTLHSFIEEGSMKLTNDFKRIREWSVPQHNAEHARDVEWLKDSLHDVRQGEARKVLIVTHYAPMFERVCHPQNERNSVSQCFSSHAMEQLKQSVGLQSVSHWIFGHTHWNAKFCKNGIYVLSNQKCNDEKYLTWWQKKFRYRRFDPQAHVLISG